MKKILSIDGGGIKGVFAVSFLAQIEEKCGGKVCDYFDMIAGTSTGGIIAAALSVGVPAGDILEFYRKYAKDIFPRNARFKIFSTKYRSRPLKNAVSEVLGGKRIKDCRTRLLIPAYNLTESRARVFKTPHARDLCFDQDILLEDVIMATTAAPLYFPPYKMEGGVFIDGGVIANNPSFMAVAEGLTRCGWRREEIALLSIGGGSGTFRTTGRERMGIMNALKIQKCFMEAGSEYADNLCGLFLNRETYLKIDFTPPEKISLDRVTDATMSNLETWGRNCAQDKIRNVKSVFYTDKKGKFQLYNVT